MIPVPARRGGNKRTSDGRERVNLAAFLHRSATTWGDRPALARGSAVAATYRAFAESAAVLAGKLRGDLGLAAGDRVAIAMTNAP